MNLFGSDHGAEGRGIVGLSGEVEAGDCPPHAEDGWKALRASGVVRDLVTPCARCTIVTTDQQTAERGPEPLRTLAQYRRREGSGDVLFGMNAVPRGPGGVVRVGDPVEILA